jgi:BarA-like signal transduction histidine kinase
VSRQNELAGELSPQAHTLEEVLYALIEPGARAALVIQEILAHSGPELTAAVEEQLQGSFKPLLRLLARKCSRNLGGHREIGDEDDVQVTR